MKKKKKENRSKYRRLAFWIGVAVVGAMLGTVVQFTRAWTEPSLPPPDGNVGAPINTGNLPQAKGLTGVTPNSPKVDKPGSIVANDFCLPGASGTCLSGGGGLPAGLKQTPPGCGGYLTTLDYCYTVPYATTSAYPGFQQCYVAGAGACGGNSLDTYSLYLKCDGSHGGYSPQRCVIGAALSGNVHLEAECTSAGGEIQVDGSNKYCKFDASACPSGWSHYKHIVTTEPHTCNSCTSCTTGAHNFSGLPVETCRYYQPGGFGSVCSYSFPDTACYATITEVGCS